MTDDYRTHGWAPGDSDSCQTWTREQHLAVAKDLLDAMCNKAYSEDAWNGEPPHRHYEAEDQGVTDYAPLLAAIAHCLIAQAAPRD